MVEHEVLLARIGLGRIVEQEAEVAGVDPEERQAHPPVLTNGAQHGAVAAHDHDQLGIVVAVSRESIGHGACCRVALVRNDQIASG